MRYDLIFWIAGAREREYISAAVLLLESRWHLFKNILEIQALWVAHFIFMLAVKGSNHQDVRLASVALSVDFVCNIFVINVDSSLPR